MSGAKLKHACVDGGQYGLGVAASDYADEGVRLLRTSDLSSDGTYGDDGIYVPGPVEQRFVVEAGDILLSRSGTVGQAFSVPAALAGSSFAGFLIRFRPNPSRAEPRFLYFVTQSQQFQSAVESDAITSTISNFNADRYANISIPLPPLAEQTRIAVFLDDQTARIDSIIAARQKQEVMLSEWWDSRLRQTMSGSGDIEVPLRSVSWWQEGPGILAKDFRDDGIPILRIAHLRATPPSLAGCQFVDPDNGLRRWGHFLTCVGDLMISGSASVGAMAVWIDQPVAGAIPYTGLIRTGVRDGKLDRNFLRYFYLSLTFTEQVDRLKQGVGIQHWGPSHLAQVRIPLPSLAEQLARAQSIAEFEAEILHERDLLRRSIGLLQEFKRSLISAAVSAEFDVPSASGREVPA